MHSCGETSPLCPVHTWALSLLSLWLLQRGMRMLALRAWAVHELRKSGTAEKPSLASSPLSPWFSVLGKSLNVHKNRENRIMKPHGPII